MRVVHWGDTLHTLIIMSTGTVSGVKEYISKLLWSVKDSVRTNSHGDKSSGELEQ